VGLPISFVLEAIQSSDRFHFCDDPGSAASSRMLEFSRISLRQNLGAPFEAHSCVTETIREFSEQCRFLVREQASADDRVASAS
jgi:hypothetical protein